MRAPPLTPHFLYSLCGVAVSLQQPTYAVGMIVAFYSLLRTGELGKIQVKDITISETGHQAFINLGLTKGGMRQGAMIHVILDFQPAVEMLQAALLGLSPGDLLIPSEIKSINWWTRSILLQ